MLLPLILAAAVAAGPYVEVRAGALERGALVPGDSGTLVGLGGEHACAGSAEGPDCEVLRRPIPPDPVVELVPITGILLPPLGCWTSSVLLPRHPYGLGEPVVLILGPESASPAVAYVRLGLDDDVAAAGPAEVRLLVEPRPLSLDPVPMAVPDPPAEGASAPDHLEIRVPMPIRIRALAAEAEGGPVVDQAWPEGQVPEPAVVHLRPPPDPVARALAGAARRCATGEAPRRGRKGRGSHEAGEVEAMLARDARGLVSDGVLLRRPWRDPALDACVVNELRRLPPRPEEAGDLLHVEVQAQVPARPAADD